MNAHTNIQIIHDKNGTPAFVVVPYGDWVAQQDRVKALVPNEVVNMVFDREWTPMRAWREYLGLTQSEIATRANISQAAYAQMEITEKPRVATIKKIATALGLTLEQLDF
ncbi:MAG: helix-turn-helix transcriptional regulator [Desulfobacteraceae bacterium]|jgi:predicted transcriptional regulator